MSARTAYGRGDLFLVVSDGVVEVTNDRDEEFGLGGLEELLKQYATRPLQEIWHLIMTAVKHHGPQEDDQSVLLIRLAG